MSKKFNFIIAKLTKLMPPKTGRDEYCDTKVPELTLRVTSSGTKSFSITKKIKYNREGIATYVCAVLKFSP
jgi:hypothetical protein